VITKNNLIDSDLASNTLSESRNPAITAARMKPGKSMVCAWRLAGRDDKKQFARRAHFFAEAAEAMPSRQI
jgi:hypothetical protein